MKLNYDPAHCTLCPRKCGGDRTQGKGRCRMPVAPVLARADIGIAMGALGSDAAIEAADVVLMDDELRKIPRAIAISRKCLKIVRENIAFSLAVKLACLILSALGITNMWAAIFADVGVMIIAVLNALRMM